MLVLSRKKKEGVVIGQNIRVTVLEITGSRVKLGFSGPPEVSIHREELFAEIEAEMERPGHAEPARECVCM